MYTQGTQYIQYTQGCVVVSEGLDEAVLSPPTPEEALKSHLVFVPTLAQYRRQAVEAAFDWYDQAQTGRNEEVTAEGAGLLVLQRTAFVTEDFGALLWARGGQIPWKRLTGYRDEPTKVYRCYAQSAVERRSRESRLPALKPPGESSEILEQFGYPPVNELLQGLNKKQANALAGLLSLHDQWLTWLLEEAGLFWMVFKGFADAAGHGFPFVIGGQADSDESTEALGSTEPEATRLFAVAFSSSVDEEKRAVVTTTSRVELDARNVGLIKQVAVNVSGAMSILALLWLRAMTGQMTPRTLPLNSALVERLPEADQAALQQVGYMS
ncbi:MAG: hypothetical protein JXA87_15910 [Thermoleophilia bacterium]|nr:hypothetical protein [Thermoleophilia bacterium]